MKNRVIAILLLLVGLARGEEVVPVTLEFAQLEKVSLKLDLYRSENLAEAHPLIVWVHGGAWRRGHRGAVPIKKLLKEGYVIASVDYRLTPVAPFPANVHDIKAAIRFLRTHAKQYGIDPNRITIAGASAGGHLAALVGVTNGSKMHEGSVGDLLNASSDVQAVVSFFGASDLLTILGQSTPHGLSVRVPALELLLGGSPVEKDKLARLASPLHQLDPKDPPLMLIHGDEDPQMPYEQSELLQAACDKTKVPCEFVTVKGGKHGGRGFFDEAMIKKVATFLSKVE